MINGKVNAVFSNRILVNVGQAKSLHLPNNKLGDAKLVPGAIIGFEGDLKAVKYTDTSTGETREGKYLASPNFKLVSVKQPKLVAQYEDIHPDAPFPTEE